MKTPFNPYLTTFRQIIPEGADPLHYMKPHVLEKRNAFIKRYAFAVPNEAVLRGIADWGPVVEMGAGYGYWARMLRASDVDVVAYDNFSWSLLFPQGRNSTPHSKVLFGEPEVLANHPDRTLLLVWPPYDVSMALDALRAYPGDRLVYVGEGHGGCTGDDSFHEELEDGWDLSHTITIPRWPTVNDECAFYRRVL